jgi:hypothetical protein
MKKIIPLILISIIFTGCSSGNTAKTAATATATANRDITDSDPLLETTSYGSNIMILTDPVLYNYLKANNPSSATSEIVVDEQVQKLIGKTYKIKDATKYGLSGILTVASSTTLKLSAFNYNGSCGSLIFKAIIAASKKEAATFGETVTTPQSNASLDLKIPTSVDLTKFDQVDIYCQGVTKSISSVAIK